MIKLYNQNIWGNMPEGHRVSNRNSLIRDMVMEEAPDFCTFQECNPGTSRAGETAMDKLIAEVYAEASAENASLNFTPVFYKKDAWTEIDSGFTPYDGLNDINSKSLTWAVLERKSDKKRVCVVSTHFWFKALSEEDFKQRLDNVRQLKGVCDDVIAKYNVPVIIAGDFNNGVKAPQGDEPYKLMVSLGFSDVRHVAKQTTDSYTCRDEYPQMNDDGIYVAGTMPTFILDFVFTYGTHLASEKFDVITTERALISSDHSPVISEFIY